VFLKKLFNKDHRYYLEKGEKYFRDERYADARNAFSEALQKLERGSAEASSLQVLIEKKLSDASNRLAMLNLSEAEHASTSGEIAKAMDHLRLVIELAEDVILREKAENLLTSLDPDLPAKHAEANHHSCNGCSDDFGKTTEDCHVTSDSLAIEDRFEVYIQTLPGNLPQRYADLGEKFAYGYLLNRDGDSEGALKVFEELSAEEENDILDYEMALLFYRNGDHIKCEKLLHRALELNGLNPLCHLGLVQLLCETGRAVEAVPLLKHMIDMRVLPDQARLLLGDVCLMLDDEMGAMDNFTALITSPNLAREAAARVIPLLEKHGRGEDATYLSKRFAKRCC
jgi:tetratricopeptide (TPR) repeat protein